MHPPFLLWPFPPPIVLVSLRGLFAVLGRTPLVIEYPLIPKIIALEILPTASIDFAFAVLVAGSSRSVYIIGISSA
jgi:hypothetical protein